MSLNRAKEFEDLLAAVTPLLSNYISQADETQFPHPQSNPDIYDPKAVEQLLNVKLPEEGKGKEGLISTLEGVLKCSVNTWGQGFIAKLYSEPTAVGVISELILATLNTNVHVYNVSPALTIIEKAVAKAFAAQFGFTGPRAGGTTQPGGSASNLSALVIARNTLHPDTKVKGCGNEKLVLFTSAHGHYSFEKAAQVCGLGSDAAWSVAVDKQGCMIVSELEKEIARARTEGYTPFFVNATAGTTVLGSYDPFPEIATVCKREGLWMHIDGSWGAPVIFSRALKHKMHGSELADSITVNPHKMLNVPVTCSFLLARDVKQVWKSNTLPASYLFHGPDDEATDTNGDDAEHEVWDLADMTLQCGRKGDALKMAMAWIFYGATGFERRIDSAFLEAAHLAQVIEKHPKLILISESPPPCLQVCFMYRTAQDTAEENTKTTKTIAKQLLARDFNVDFASGDKGAFFRVVVHLSTRRSTLQTLVDLICELGSAL